MRFAQLNKTSRWLLALTVLFLLTQQRAMAADPEDITATYKDCMTVTPSTDQALLTNKNITSVMTIDMSANASLKLDWSGCAGATTDQLVQGVFIHTNGEVHAGCMIEFYVDSIKCATTNSAGVDAQGGVFNCGKSGKSFEARFGDSCTANL